MNGNTHELAVITAASTDRLGESMLGPAIQIRKGFTEALQTDYHFKDPILSMKENSSLENSHATLENLDFPLLKIKARYANSESSTSQSSVSLSPTQSSLVSSSSSTVGLPCSQPHELGDDSFVQNYNFAGIKDSNYSRVGPHEGVVRHGIKSSLLNRDCGLPNGPVRPKPDAFKSHNENKLFSGPVYREVVPSCQGPRAGDPYLSFGPREKRSRTLQARLLGNLHKIPGHEERKGFFPEDTFKNLISEQTVSIELHHCFPQLESHAIERLSGAICRKEKPLRKIFSLLVLIDKVSDICQFIQEDVTDFDLPLCKVPYEGTNIFQLARRGEPSSQGGPLQCFDGWRPLEVWTFEEWQWTALAPFFYLGTNKAVRHFIFPDQVPLPFTADSRCGENFNAIQGGFSTVFKVDIHPAHYNSSSSEIPGRSFAVKRLSSKDRAQFKTEAEMLMTFSGDAHPHLISLLATYDQFNRFYLIFPWAESDLLGYCWRKNPTPKMDHATVQWVAEQCSGMAKALSKLHRHRTMNLSRWFDDYNQTSDSSRHWMQCTAGDGPPWHLELCGRHGDIKPQNVLWFPDPHDPTRKGTLKITDFGLSEFKTSARKIYKRPSRVALSAPYRAPECDTEGDGVGQSHDIWALGCLYLELIGWLLGGYTLVRDFQKQRGARSSASYHSYLADGPFFEVHKDGLDGKAVAIVKPVVTKFIQDLRSHPTCSKYVSEFLDIIQAEMLVVKPSDPRDKGRTRIGELIPRLIQLYQRCDSIEFATASASA